jgi:hypothetical protein
VLREAGELGYEHRDIAGLFEALGKIHRLQAETRASAPLG